MKPKAYLKEVAGGWDLYVPHEVKHKYRVLPELNTETHHCVPFLTRDSVEIFIDDHDLQLGGEPINEPPLWTPFPVGGGK
jgi:hypothetical protein